jgi:2-dehydropantoate 2-reductase
MKIAVVGSGAMGSIYAGRLALAGNDVLAVSRRDDHVCAINSKGLRIDAPTGSLIATLRASSTALAERMDLVVLAMKAADVAQGTESALPMIGDETAVIAIQNGLGSADTVASIVGPECVAVGIASGFGASLVGPGHVHHNAMKAMRFGAYAGLPHERIVEIASVWRSAGFDADAVEDIIAMQWEKLICNVAYSAPCALTGLTVGEVMDDPAVGPISQAAAIEAWNVAKASGVRINVSDPVAHVRAFGAQMRAAKPSALQDHEAQRPSEVDVINGAVVREADKFGLSASVNQTLTALVKVKESRWSH